MQPAAVGKYLDHTFGTRRWIDGEETVIKRRGAPETAAGFLRRALREPSAEPLRSALYPPMLMLSYVDRAEESRAVAG